MLLPIACWGSFTLGLAQGHRIWYLAALLSLSHKSHATSSVPPTLSILLFLVWNASKHLCIPETQLQWNPPVCDGASELNFSWKEGKRRNHFCKAIPTIKSSFTGKIKSPLLLISSHLKKRPVGMFFSYAKDQLVYLKLLTFVTMRILHNIILNQWPVLLELFWNIWLIFLNCENTLSYTWPPVILREEGAE